MSSEYKFYNDPVVIHWREGTEEDPYINITQKLKIANNTIVLSEIPDSFTHVIIEGFSEIYYEDDKEVYPKGNEFIVNYSNGIVTFDDSHNGKLVIARYRGRGFVQYPAERIYAQNENTNVLTNLQEIINSGQDGIDALNSIDDRTGTYVHDQLSSSNKWVVDHNLAKYPSVTITDSAGTVVQGDIEYNTDNRLTIRFESSFGGIAYLN